MKVLGVIPARGGSKGVPRKNLVSMGGKPLIEYTIKVALEVSSRVSPLVVSTEDEEIAEVALGLGAEVPFVRPDELAGDRAASVDVLRHAISQVESNRGSVFDWVLLLQPTSPFRTRGDIESALDLASAGGCDSVISVVPVVESHPAYIKRIVNDRLEPFCVEEVEGTRRQDLQPPAFKRNGAIYLTRRDIVMVERSIWGSSICPYVMPPERSINIDTPLDLLLAEAQLAENHQANNLDQ